MYYYMRIKNNIFIVIFIYYFIEMGKNGCMVFSNFIIMDNDVFVRDKFWFSFVLYFIKFELWICLMYMI